MDISLASIAIILPAFVGVVSLVANSLARLLEPER